MADKTLVTLCVVASVAACSTHLRLDIFNATDSEIVVVAGGNEDHVEPGLSYSATFPASGSTITVRASTLR